MGDVRSMLSGLHATLERIAVRAGLHAKQPEFGAVRLERRRIFILPTRTGLMFGAGLLVMLLTSVNYQLALGYALTFLIASVALVSMLHTWRNLLNLHLQAGRAEPIYAGERLEWSILVSNPSQRERHAIELLIPGSIQTHVFDCLPHTEQLITVALPTQARGWLQVPRMRITCCWPLGLWRAWAWWQPRTALLVWPRLENPAPPWPDDGQHGQVRSGVGLDDFAAIRPFQAGDSPRRLAWKAMARLGTDDCLTLQHEGGRGGEVELNWYCLPAALDAESRLSRLARWVTDADQAGVHYSLQLPGRRLPLERGPAHRMACLEALALAEV